eukprot:m51a1_g12179 putative cysteine proteinase (198) ;mRNA; r:3356-3995
MKAIFAALVLAALASASPIDTFRTWAKAHGKVYTASEEKYRMIVFEENTAIVSRLNVESHGAHFATNKFSDLTNKKFKTLYTADLHLCQQGPSSGAVAAGNQGLGTMRVKNTEVVSLSEQQLVSCDKRDSGCNAGHVTTADQYIIETGLASEQEYPFVSGNGSVPRCRAFTVQYKFSNSKDFRSVLSDDTIIKYLRQ